MSAKATLGYSSRTDAVLALRAQRLSTKEIAARIGVSANTVTALEHSAGRKRRSPRPTEEMGRTIVFPVDVLDSLRPFAARRGVHVNALARRLVVEAVDGKLVDAILDDDE